MSSEKKPPRDIKNLPTFEELQPLDADARGRFCQFLRITPEEYRLITSDYFKRNPPNFDEPYNSKDDEVNEEEELKERLAKYGMKIEDLFIPISNHTTPKPFVSRSFHDHYSDNDEDNDIDVDVSDLIEYCEKNQPQPYYFPTSTKELDKK